MTALDKGWEQRHDIDWKNVVENYVEDYHFPTGHPGLSALMEAEYQREVSATGAMRLSHRMRERPLRNWSAERYAKLLPPAEHLPAELHRRWTYFGLFPNVYFDVYPEWLDYFHVIPTGPGQVRLRGRTFGFPDERREMRAARYLSVRINRQVQAEDNALTRSVQQGLASSAYQAGILSEKEIVLKGFQDWVRARLPVTRLRTAPPRGTMAAENRRLAV
jgi:phenylpropionate dioxygenase-like ring-hydroxylating dioxygenase large terminal subunit